eukprot:jgi/Chlat1/532/Chrsp103S01119
MAAVVAMDEEAAEVVVGPAQDDGEVFEVFDEDGRLIGREKRGVVHRLGLLHRSVYCFVFNSLGELLLQRRSAGKDIAPLAWDLSCAEHLQPGETFQQGAERGLREELGIEGISLEDRILDTHVRKLEYPEKGFKDYEFVQAFKLSGWDNGFQIDKAEVSDAKFFPLREVQCWASESPQDFTPWFLDEIQLLNWFEPART